MARVALTPQQTTDLRNALENAFPSEAAFRSVVTLTSHKFDSVSTPGQVLPIRILETIKHAETNDWLFFLINTALAENNDPAVRKIRDQITISNPPAGISPYDMVRLGGGAVMVDRKPLRDAVEELVDDLGRRILVIKGNPLGKSHSVQLLNFVADHVGGFEIIHVDLDPRRDEQTRLEITAHDLATRLVRLTGYTMEVAEAPTDRQWSKWIEVFGEKFQKAAADHAQRRWLVIDGINKVLLDQSAVDLVHDLTTRIKAVLSKIRLILIGYEQTLPTLVVPTIQKDEPKKIDINDLLEFFEFVHVEVNAEVDGKRIEEIVKRVVTQVDLTASNSLIPLAPVLAHEVRKIKRGPR